MKLQRFYVAVPIKMSTSPVTVPSLELLNQLKRVLRMEEQDEVILFDDYGMQFLASIEAFKTDGVSFKILEERGSGAKPQRETWLFTALVKKDNFEWIAQKATELGVSHIVPLLTSRTEKKDFNQERLTKVCIEAAEQSGRTTLPVIHDILKLAEALEQYAYVRSVAWDPYAEVFTRKVIEEINGSYIGPEGGWTEEELQMFKDHGVRIYSLGPQILRTETAVVAVLSQLVF
jgi:16S rRNA (uracil1498-N3)-methyltransferase